MTKRLSPEIKDLLRQARRLLAQVQLFEELPEDVRAKLRAASQHLERIREDYRRLTREDATRRR